MMREKIRGSGRKKGSLNKHTWSAKEAFQLAFDKIGGADALAEWSSRNRTDFYKIYGRLIPADVKVDPEANTINVQITHFTKALD